MVDDARIGPHQRLWPAFSTTSQVIDLISLHSLRHSPGIVFFSSKPIRKDSPTICSDSETIVDSFANAAEVC